MASGGSNLRDHRGGFIYGSAITTGKTGEGVRFQFQHESGSTMYRPRLIKSGTLRKATARSVGRLGKTTWKTKYVELTPGSFAYSDNGPTVLGKRYACHVQPFYRSELVHVEGGACLAKADTECVFTKMKLGTQLWVPTGFISLAGGVAKGGERVLHTGFRTFQGWLKFVWLRRAM